MTRARSFLKRYGIVLCFIGIILCTPLLCWWRLQPDIEDLRRSEARIKAGLMYSDYLETQRRRWDAIERGFESPYWDEFFSREPLPVDQSP